MARKVVFVLALFLLCAAAALASPTREPSVIVSYSSETGRSVHLQTIKDGVFSLNSPTRYKVNAFVEPVTVEKDVVSRRLRPKVDDITFSPSHAWTVDQKGIMSLKKRPGEKGTYKMKINFTWNVLDSDEYPFFLFSWRQAHSTNPPEIVFEFEPDKKRDREKDVSLKSHYPFDASNLAPVQEISLKDAVFESKSLGYILGRMWGTSLDEKWHYSKYNGATVIQRRFDTPVSEAGAMRITFKRGAAFKGINIRLDTDGDGKGDRVVHYADLICRQEETDASLHKTVDLLETAKKLNLDPKKVRLSEVIVYLADDIERVKSEKIIEHIHFYQRKDQCYFTPLVSSAGGVNYFVLDVRKCLEEKGLLSGGISGVAMAFSFRDDQPQDIAVEDMQFFDTVKRTVPTAFEEPEKRLKEFFNPSLPPQHMVKNYDVLWWINDVRLPLKDLLPRQKGRTGDNAWKEDCDKVSFQDIRQVLEGKQGTDHARGKSGGVNVLPLTLLGNGIDKDLQEITPGPVFDEFYFDEKEKKLVLVKDLDRRVKGDLFFSCPIESKFSGRTLEITYRDARGEKRSLRKLIVGDNYIPLGLPPSSILKQIRIALDNIEGNGAWPENENLFRIVYAFIIEVNTGEISAGPRRTDDIFWVRNNGDVLFRPTGMETTPQGEVRRDTFFLELPPGGNREWKFRPEKSAVHKIVEFSMSYEVPDDCECRGSLSVDNKSAGWNFYNGKSVKNMLLQISPRSEDIALSISCRNYSEAPATIVIGRPMITALGIREDLSSMLPDEFVRIDKAKAQINYDAHGVLEGKWVESDDIFLDAKEHTFAFADNPYLRVKSLMLEARPPYEIPVTKPPEAVRSVFKGLFAILLKVFIYGFIIFLIYAKREFIGKILGRLFHFIRDNYSFIPDDGWFILWLVMSAGMYALGLGKVDKVQSDFYTFGGVFFVMAFAHFTKLIQPWFRKYLPGLAEYVYRGRSGPFFAGALCLLVLVPVLLIGKFEKVAEQVAIIVYYFLVIGVVLEIFNLRKKEKEGSLENGRDN